MARNKNPTSKKRGQRQMERMRINSRKIKVRKIGRENFNIKEWGEIIERKEPKED